jgi:hypothetical protein
LADRQVFFLHLPKTAGMSFLKILETRFEEDEMLVTTHHDLAPISIEEIQSYRFVVGHVGAPFIDRLSPRPVVLTMVRDPIERAISHYYYLRSYPQDQLPPDYRRHFRHACESHSLLDYMDRCPQEAVLYLSNVQTRFLGPADSVDIQLHSREFLEQAQRNLERFEFFGLLERFQDSLRLLSHALKWPPLKEPPHINKTPNRIKQSELDPETLGRLTELNELDLELYETACTIFESRYSQMLDRSPRSERRASRPSPSAHGRSTTSTKRMQSSYHRLGTLDARDQ